MRRYRQYYYHFVVTYPSGKMVQRYDVVIASKREDALLIARRAMKRERWLQSGRGVRVGKLSYGLMLRPTFNKRYSAGSLIRLPRGGNRAHA